MAALPGLQNAISLRVWVNHFIVRYVQLRRSESVPAIVARNAAHLHLFLFVLHLVSSCTTPKTDSAVWQDIAVPILFPVKYCKCIV